MARSRLYGHVVGVCRARHTRRVCVPSVCVLGMVANHRHRVHARRTARRCTSYGNTYYARRTLAGRTPTLEPARCQSVCSVGLQTDWQCASWPVGN